MNAEDDDGAGAERARLDALYLAIFENDRRGQAVFDDLYARFVRRPSTTDFTQEGMLKAFVQTHQREVIEYIVRCVNRASGVQDPTPPAPGIPTDERTL